VSGVSLVSSSLDRLDEKFSAVIICVYGCASAAAVVNNNARDKSAGSAFVSLPVAAHAVFVIFHFPDFFSCHFSDFLFDIFSEFSDCAGYKNIRICCCVNVMAVIVHSVSSGCGSGSADS
jgi:hypothetical protein